MKDYILKQISVTGIETNKNKFYFEYPIFVISSILCFNDSKLAKLDSSTKSCVIMSFTEITTVENHNYCNTKLIRSDSSTTCCLIRLLAES